MPLLLPVKVTFILVNDEANGKHFKGSSTQPDCSYKAGEHCQAMHLHSQSLSVDKECKIQINLTLILQMNLKVALTETWPRIV